MTATTMDRAERLLTPRDLAERWACSPGWLANERSEGRGAPYVKLGAAVRYRLADIEAHEAASLIGAVA